MNRGVEKREIFLDNEDYLRFAYNLYDFNDKNLTTLSYYARHRRRQLSSAIVKPNKEKDKLVDILCWCSMSNHFHILVQEKRDGGVGLFARKITSGFTQYFNLKNNRSGVLFQGKTKIIPVKRDEHFLYLPYYIFSNPIKLIEPYWKEKGIKNLKKTIKFLEDYKWSSYSDIIGKGNFSFIIKKKLFFEIFDTNEKQFKKDFIEWLWL